MRAVYLLLSKFTMYRLMLYYLMFLVIFSAGLSFSGFLPYSGFDILAEAFYLMTICWFSNQFLGKTFKVPTNPESPPITGLILTLIFGPVSPLINPFIGLVAILAMASKYILAFQKKHFFNPAAFGAVVSAVLLNQGASWWVGNLPMLIPTLLGGLLILKKLRRFEMVLTFLGLYLLISFNNIPNILLASPIIFFSLVMVVEPLTSPPTKNLQIIYAAVIVVANFVYQHIWPGIFYGLELSLLTGNAYSYIVSKNFRQVLTLKEKVKLSHDVVGFWWEPWKKFQFQSGQYLEWTLAHKNPDTRGIRRFFTIASSPTEDLILLATKFYEKPGTFKQTLRDLKPGDEIIASNLEGEFTLPKDQSIKLCLIAGGIGITPFRSQAKSMIDCGERRDIILLYSNKTAKDIVFKDIFKKADKQGWRTVYINTDQMGFIDEKVIKEIVADWQERMFYVSGPEPMVEAFEKMLYRMGLKKSQVKRDYFEGYSETHQK